MEKLIPIGHGAHFGIMRINANETYEVNHWSKQLKVSEEQLLAAVERVALWLTMFART